MQRTTSGGRFVVLPFGERHENGESRRRAVLGHDDEEWVYLLEFFGKYAGVVYGHDHHVLLQHISCPYLKKQRTL